jgi:hypothetical protein
MQQPSRRDNVASIDARKRRFGPAFGCCLLAT